MKIPHLTALIIAIGALSLSIPSSASLGLQAGERGMRFISVGASYAEISVGGTESNQITLDWRHVLPSGRTVRATENLAASFVTMCFTDGGNGRLLVGGLSIKTRNTIVQSWTLREPQLIRTFPTGEAVLHPRGISKIKVLQDDKAPNRRGVMDLARFHKTKSHFLALYRSGDVWEFPLGGTPPKMVCSPSGKSSSVTVPITVHHHFATVANHVDHGLFITVLSGDRSKQDVVLIDGNRDGVLDDAFVINDAIRDKMELDNPAKWIP